MNSYEELQKEVDIRRRKAGDLTFVDYKLKPENCRYVYYSIMEMVAEGIQKRYGSLTDRMMNGTGMGCAMFDVGVKQMAGVIPKQEEILSPVEKQKVLAKNSCDFQQHWNRTIYVPNTYLPSYNTEAELLSSADVGILSLLLSGNDAQAFMYWGSYILNNLVELAQEKLEGMEGLKESKGLSFLSSALEKVSGLLEGTKNEFLSQIVLSGAQALLKDKTIINETLNPNYEGYPFDEVASAKNETLQFWDPQLYADWTKSVHNELVGLDNGSVSKASVACIEEKQKRYLPKTEGYLIGLEVDWTDVKAPAESVFLNYDQLRAENGEDVDPFKKFDGETDALPKIFKRVVTGN